MYDEIMSVYVHHDQELSTLSGGVMNILSAEPAQCDFGPQQAEV